MKKLPQILHYIIGALTIAVSGYIVFIIVLIFLSLFGVDTKFNWLVKVGEINPSQETMDHYNRFHPAKK